MGERELIGCKFKIRDEIFPDPLISLIRKLARPAGAGLVKRGENFGLKVIRNLSAYGPQLLRAGIVIASFITDNVW